MSEEGAVDRASEGSGIKCESPDTIPIENGVDSETAAVASVAHPAEPYNETSIANDGVSPTETAAVASSKQKSHKIDKSEAAEDDTPKTFPQILMEILCNDEENDTISWLPHGRSFIIYKKKKFGNQILPKYFKATKFTSFTRKLNRWGFTRVTRGPEMGSYFHKLFLRDDPQLCLRMSSHSSNKFQEPNAILPNPMSPAGVPFMPYGMIPNMLPPGMTQVDVAQQNQIINQQLQQLQWQQYQLQQYQQQQQVQQHNHANGPPPASGAPPGTTGQTPMQHQQQQQPPPLQPLGMAPVWGQPMNPAMVPNLAMAPMSQGRQLQPPRQLQQQQQQQHGGQPQNLGNPVAGNHGAGSGSNS
ncbi:HSF-type DNA-binding protein [Nitzschia inconspicua]|uniref:HSF-type DNA-binding protein n=1 Tax=Nitzschia inconspicua TaxID=303405 RepID=A0A9K3Q6M0_9STRA|nr:HSF-type DNA-binding protein [Nitzschia inconspicua]